jgi:hypothetical protein
MSAQEGENGIRTSNLRFIRRDPNRLNYFLRTNKFVISNKQNIDDNLGEKLINE